MTSSSTPPSAPPAPADTTLLGALAHWTSIHDPGGIDRGRALHLALAFILIITLGYATSQAFGLGMDVTYPMMGATMTVVFINFAPAASLGAEARSMARLFVLCFAYLALVAVIAPGNHPLNATMQKLALVPLSFYALYLRRYGMDGQRKGLALIIVATVATVLSPTRETALWLLLAAAQGAAITAAVRLGTWRPSAREAFLRTASDMEEEAARLLRRIADAARAGQKLPPDIIDVMEDLRPRVWNALANAVQAEPQARAAFEQLRVYLYRLRVAVELLIGCIPEKGGSKPDWHPPFSAAADHIARLIEALPDPDVHSAQRFERAKGQLMEAAFSPDLDPRSRFALMRAVTAFDRLALIVGDLARFVRMHRANPSLSREGGEAMAPPKPIALLTVGPDGKKRLSAPMKVTLQGLVATTITTALDLVVGLDHAYWATMTVMFVMGNSVGETFVRVRYRTLGTLVGVAVGLGVVLLLGHRIWLLAGLCLIGQMIAIVTQRDRYDIASAVIGFSVVVGLHLISGLGAEGMLSRAYETAIGAGVALTVAYFVMPVYVADQSLPQVDRFVRRLRGAFASWWPHEGTDIGMEGLMLDLRALSAQLPHVGAETQLGRQAGDFANILSTLDILSTYLTLMQDASRRLKALSPAPAFVTPVEAARSRTLTAFDSVLGEATEVAGKAGTPAVEAAISLALDIRESKGSRVVLPLVADYLAYSEAVLQPLSDLKAALANQAPWRAGSKAKAPPRDKAPLTEETARP